MLKIFYASFFCLCFSCLAIAELSIEEETSCSDSEVSGINDQLSYNGSYCSSEVKGLSNEAVLTIRSELVADVIKITRNNDSKAILLKLPDLSVVSGIQIRTANQIGEFDQFRKMPVIDSKKIAKLKDEKWLAIYDLEGAKKYIHLYWTGTNMLGRVYYPRKIKIKIFFIEEYPDLESESLLRFYQGITRVKNKPALLVPPLDLGGVDDEVNAPLGGMNFLDDID